MSTIFVVGIGPGAYEKMTIEAADALRNCDVIIGYTVYVDLVKEHFEGKGSRPAVHFCTAGRLLAGQKCSKSIDFQPF